MMRAALFLNESEHLGIYKVVCCYSFVVKFCNL